MGGVTALYELANGLCRRGHRVNVVHEAFWGRSISSLDEVSWFRFEPDVRHYFGGVTEDPAELDADIIFGTEAPRRRGLPVFLLQGLDMFPGELEQELLRKPSLKACVASWLVDRCQELGVPAEQLVYQPLGIDHTSFRCEVAPGERPPRIGLLYHAHPAKGWHTAVRALRRLRRRLPDVEVLAFGATLPDELPDWISFLHAPDPPTVARDVYNRCSIFLQASRWEGFGFTAVEAMACGAALVTTDNGGSRDYALDGETALVAPPGSAEVLADHLERLLRDEDLRLRLATAGAELARGFSWDHAAEVLEGHLERYLANPDRVLGPAEAAG